MGNSTNTILCSKSNKVTTVTINRPRYHNSITADMWEELTNTLSTLDEDQETRCIIITGRGENAFSAGADIQEFQTQRIDSKTGYSYNQKVDKLLSTIRTLQTPIIAMINGIAAGGGCEISVACDLRIASTNCRIGIPVARLGITIGHTEMKSLVELVGRSTALYILLSANLLDSTEALRVGLVNQVVPQEDLQNVTNKLALQIAELAPLSHSVNKQTLNQIYEIPNLENLNEQQKALPLNQFDTDDYKEGFNAFLEKRKPEFKGK
ncbi:MAG: crotonase [SAR202 cluster bacterium]|nr:crotonase [SAR202 cluster bacterium]MQG36477.1 crotonase [SAR202 cluster bacterium]MQG86740.1 crotonase [SAR202 cluster bacterium]